MRRGEVQHKKRKMIADFSQIKVPNNGKNKDRLDFTTWCLLLFLIFFLIFFVLISKQKNKGN